MKINRNASSAIFGYQFQIDSAIWMFINEIEKIKYLKSEGKFEDIEFLYENNTLSYVQVKAVHDPSKKDADVQKLKKALEHFNNHDCVDNLIYCTNQNNPISTLQSSFCGKTVQLCRYNDLTLKEKEIVNRYLNENTRPKLTILKIPYENHINNRHTKRCIIEVTQSFLNKINETRVRPTDLIDKWFVLLFNSSTSSKNSYIVQKREFGWIYIVVLIDSIVISPQFNDKKLNTSFIDETVASFEISTKILDFYEKTSVSDIEVFIAKYIEDLHEIIFGAPYAHNLENRRTIEIIVDVVLQVREKINILRKEISI